MVPPRCAMPRTESFVSGTTWSSPIKPANPRLIPSTSHPRLIADRTAARMTAFRPGASPPPVEMAILMRETMSADVWDRSRRRSVSLQQVDDLTRLGVSVEFRLLEYRRSVGDDFEPAAARRDQFDLGAGNAITNLRRQPDGARFVVSHRAVFDGDFHAEKIDVWAYGRVGVREARFPYAHAPIRPHARFTSECCSPP